MPAMHAPQATSCIYTDDSLTKPLNSLGQLEKIALQVYMIQGGRLPSPDPARCYTIAGDHGVVAEGISLFPQEVTRQMVQNFLHGGAAINVLTRSAQAEIMIVDAGCCGQEHEDHPLLIKQRIRSGTGNIAIEPAMSHEQCLEAIFLGIKLAKQAHEAGIKTLLTGEMGIGNTTASTALFCAFLGLDPYTISGPGTGLQGEKIQHKAKIIAKALHCNKAHIIQDKALHILAALGGLEIATLAGLILGGASNKQVLLIDGFISTAAYLAAWKLCPHVAEYCILAHASAEPGHIMVLQKLGLRPLLDLSMCLGEGTGSALALMLVRAACDTMREMATFSEAQITAKISP